MLFAQSGRIPTGERVGGVAKHFLRVRQSRSAMSEGNNLSPLNTVHAGCYLIHSSSENNLFM
jgi:hypothetical protein